MIALVTGGGGFLGGAIVRRLLDRGEHVHSFSRSFYPELAALGVEQHLGNLADPFAVQRALTGCDLVFHVAARAGLGGTYAAYHAANVTGTENVIAACRLQRVPRLVYTSSPSVVFDGRDQKGTNESAPYPARFEAHYPRTKAIAERAVLTANGPELATVALRPHLIWGPDDNHLIPRIVSRARAGRLRRIGRSNKLIDSTFIDNAADAHILAADRLTANSVIAGKVYFISNGEPLPLWDLVNRILAAAGLGPVERTVPFRVAYGVGWILEKGYAILRSGAEPPMTRFLARELTTAHWFDLTAARADLGFAPRVSIAEGLERLKRSFPVQPVNVR